jgi:hypothetical protein
LTARSISISRNRRAQRRFFSERTSNIQRRTSNAEPLQTSAETTSDFEPLSLPPRLRGRSRFGAAKARPTPAISHRVCGSAPTTICTGARPSGRFNVSDFLRRGFSVTSRVCATRKRRKRRAPATRASATQNRYPIGWERENRLPSAGVANRFGSCERQVRLFPLPSGICLGQERVRGHLV